MSDDNVLTFKENNEHKKDVRTGLELLLNEADAGTVKGYSIAVSYADGQCRVDAVGCHAANAIFAAGAAMVIVNRMLKKACD